MLASAGMEAQFYFIDRPVLRRRPYEDLESIFPYPPGRWSDPSATRMGRRATEDIMYPHLEGLQFETFDAQVAVIEMRYHERDLVMAVLRDRLEERWAEVFQGPDDKELPPSYWGRYHKLIYVEPGRAWMEEGGA